MAENDVSPDEVTLVIRTRITAGEARMIAKEEIAAWADALEGRLATAMTKALDIVTATQNLRLKALEEDQARILRHLGLEE